MGDAGEAFASASGVIQLDSPIEIMRRCSTCDREQRFMVTAFCASGRVATCVVCDDTVVIPYRRAHSEAVA
jgi:hypothetical protein